MQKYVLAAQWLQLLRSGSPHAASDVAHSTHPEPLAHFLIIHALVVAAAIAATAAMRAGNAIATRASPGHGRAQQAAPPHQRVRVLAKRRECKCNAPGMHGVTHAVPASIACSQRPAAIQGTLPELRLPLLQPLPAAADDTHTSKSPPTDTHRRREGRQAYARDEREGRGPEWRNKNRHCVKTGVGHCQLGPLHPQAIPGRLHARAHECPAAIGELRTTCVPQCRRRALQPLRLHRHAQAGAAAQHQRQLLCGHAHTEGAGRQGSASTLCGRSASHAVHRMEGIALRASHGRALH
eukprot:304062-Chlamydomonas_euryale.AAC.6